MKVGIEREVEREKVDALTWLVLGIFRASGALGAAGDRVLGEGLSSARFQVLGALALAGEPLTVPGVARGLGLSRQGVQKQVDRLVRERLVVLVDNPAHRRSPWLRLSPAGRRVFGRANRRWRQLAAGLAAPHSYEALVRAGRLVERLNRALAEGAAQGRT